MTLSDLIMMLSVVIFALFVSYMEDKNSGKD